MTIATVARNCRIHWRVMSADHPLVEGIIPGLLDEVAARQVCATFNAANKSALHFWFTEVGGYDVEPVATPVGVYPNGMSVEEDIERR